MTDTTYTLKPAGVFDLADPRVTRHAGAEVRKVERFGSPPNGMAYVERVDTGEFVGLVNAASLAPRRNETER